MTYQFGAFRVDRERLEVTRGNELIPLNRRAVQVLIALIERDGDLVTKEELVESVWGARGATINNLSQHVFMLRNALRTGEDDNSFILTVPRVGYRFVGDVRRDRAESTGQVLAQHYCRNARHLLEMRTEPSINSAVTLYQQALQEDPRSADAFGGLAVCRFLLAEYMYEPQLDTLTQAERDAFRALELDPRHAQALDVLGACASLLRYAWRESEQLLLSAIRERPDYLWAHLHLASQYVGQGRLTQAWQAVAQAESLSASEDTYPRLPLLRGSLHYFSQAYAAAIAELDAIVSDHPTYALARHMLAKALLCAGDYEQAQRHVEQALRVQYDPLRPGQPNARERLMTLEVWTRRAAGDEAGAREAAQRFEEFARHRPTSRICSAFAALALGERERALHFIREGVERRDPLALNVMAEPLFVPLRELHGWRDVTAALNIAS